MIEKLKPYGLHHALPVFIISWAACFIFNPSIGMAVAIYGAGRYEGRELTQAEYRGLRPFKIKTWSLDKIEWTDFLTVWAMSAFNVFIMNGM